MMRGRNGHCCSSAAALTGHVRDCCAQGFLAANPDRNATAPLPPVALRMVTPYLMFALGTRT